MSEQTRSGKPSDRLPQDIILKVLVGSQAYGTANEESDRDERCVFVVPTTKLLTVDASGRNKVRDTLWVEGFKEGQDLTGWEVQKFINLCLHANPNALECLWAPVLGQDEWGFKLRTLRQSFLVRRRVYEAYRGYSQNQRLKMLNEPEVGWTRRNWKFAEAYLRVLFQGCVLLENATIPIDIATWPPEYHGHLCAIKQGEMALPDVMEIARFLEGRLVKSYNSSKLPEEPDIEAINDFLLNLRLGHWEDILVKEV